MNRDRDSNDKVDFLSDFSLNVTTLILYNNICIVC